MSSWTSANDLLFTLRLLLANLVSALELLKSFLRVGFLVETSDYAILISFVSYLTLLIVSTHIIIFYSANPYLKN